MNDTEKIEHIFDAYCKSVIRHAAANAHNERKRRMAKAATFSALAPRELDKLGSRDDYAEDRQTLTVRGREVEFSDADLCAAVLHLSESYREILILAACYDLSDAAISDMLSIPRSTVQYRRVAALNQIRKFLEESE